MLINRGVVLAATLTVTLLGVMYARPARADAPRTRDGLFLRLGVGVSGLSMTRDGSVSAGGSAPYYTGESRISGGGSAAELTIGGMLRPGLMLGATILSHETGANPTLRADGGDVRLAGPLRFALLGASLEYFPNPRGGFHFGGTLALAFAWAEVPPPRWTEYLGGGGGAISLGAGYLWWVSDGWSLGLLARATGARIHGETTQVGITGAEDDNVSAFSLAFTGVYN
jgi:hypothetical protein